MNPLAPLIPRARQLLAAVVLVPALAFVHACTRSPISDAASVADAAKMADIADVPDRADVADAADAGDAADQGNAVDVPDGADVADAAGDAPEPGDAADAPYGADASACGLDGAVSISPEITLAALPPGQSQALPAVAFDGTNYLVVWQQGPSSGAAWQIFGARVTRDGTVLDSPPIQIRGMRGREATRAVVAFNGNDFVVAWVDTRVGPNQIYAARVTSLGAIRDPDGILVPTNAYDSYTPSLACGRSGCLLAWQAAVVNGGTFVSRLDTSLTALDAPALLLAPDGVSSSVVALPSGFFVAWNDGRESTMVAAFVNAAGNLMGSTVKVRPNGYGIPPSVSSDGTTGFVVWASSDSVGYTGLHGARIRVGATAIDPLGIAIAGPQSAQPYSAVAFDGRQFVAVWQGESYVLQWARISTAGALLDSPGSSLTGNKGENWPVIASPGDGTVLVAYAHPIPSDANTFVDLSLRAKVMTTCAGP